MLKGIQRGYTFLRTANPGNVTVEDSRDMRRKKRRKHATWSDWAGQDGRQYGGATAAGRPPGGGLRFQPRCGGAAYKVRQCGRQLDRRTGPEAEWAKGHLDHGAAGKACRRHHREA